MKATIQQIVQSVGAFRKLAMADLPLPTARRLSRCMDAVQRELDFFEAERAKIIARYHMDGQPGAENTEQADKDFRELLQMETDVAAERLEIPMNEQVSLSANDVGALAPFIDFVEDSHG